MSQVTRTTTVDEIVPGVYRCGSSRINWYLIEEDERVTVVDAGLPDHWDILLETVNSLGYDIDDIDALVLTHAHSDHIGFAERLRDEAAVPVFVHEADAAMARGDGGGAPMGKMLKNVWRGAVVGLLIEISRGGGLSTPPLTEVETFDDQEELDVPGKPRVIHTPGHSEGSCVLYLPDRNVLFSGDTLATVDIVTGRANGPQLMSLFTGDEYRAATSLDSLDGIGEVTLLPGHGSPWHGEMTDAVESARKSQ